MRGLIRYTALAPTPAPSPYVQLLPYNLTQPYADPIPAGGVQEILLGHYSTLDESSKPVRSLVRAVSGYAAVQSFGKQESRRIGVQFVEHVRGNGIANPYAVYLALLDALDAGAVVQWFEDIDAWPNEYVLAVGGERTNPQRSGVLQRFAFAFDLAILPASQLPQALPPFV